ncbi:hypothetical protein TNCV_1204441 [Trichonephila clavipes]|nr:hypothetical protein TNCV_1204441 [Trichonephila clavipes]
MHQPTEPSPGPDCSIKNFAISNEDSLVSIAVSALGELADHIPNLYYYTPVPPLRRRLRAALGRRQIDSQDALRGLVPRSVIGETGDRPYQSAKARSFRRYRGSS